jgi:hypothetical protein
MVLQRVVVDFCADHSFATAVDKLVEHYGVLLPENTLRRATLQHAKTMLEQTPVEQNWPQRPGVSRVVAEMDGSMVPIVVTDTSAKDRRRGKHSVWREAKLSLAHDQRSCELHYGGTLTGDVEEAGQRLFDCALRAGFGRATQLHAVGDGAEWIARQVADKFANNASYLIDFYHACDYLSAAAKALHTVPETTNAWFAEQKDRLKTGHAEQVIAALAPHVEAKDMADIDAPIRRCWRYLDHRRDQLGYSEAIANGLPIGSGEIESAHRYVIQQRLKRPGAWWRLDHAGAMLALRLTRANRQWNAYWHKHHPNTVYPSVA